MPRREQDGRGEGERGGWGRREAGHGMKMQQQTQLVHHPALSASAFSQLPAVVGSRQTTCWGEHGARLYLRAIRLASENTRPSFVCLLRVGPSLVFVSTQPRFRLIAYKVVVLLSCYCCCLTSLFWGDAALCSL